jgi:hypothetical protein
MFCHPCCSLCRGDLCSATPAALSADGTYVLPPLLLPLQRGPTFCHPCGSLCRGDVCSATPAALSAQGTYVLPYSVRGQSLPHRVKLCVNLGVSEFRLCVMHRAGDIHTGETGRAPSRVREFKAADTEGAGVFTGRNCRPSGFCRTVERLD